MSKEARKLLDALVNLRYLSKDDPFLENLSLNQLIIFLKLMESPEGEQVMMSQLSEVCRISRPATSQAINRLERNGLVTRKTCKTNRRVVYVDVTEKGEQLFQSEIEKLINHFDLYLDKMGKEDADELIRLLNKFIEIIRLQENEKER